MSATLEKLKALRGATVSGKWPTGDYEFLALLDYTIALAEAAEVATKPAPDAADRRRLRAALDAEIEGL